MDIRTLKAQYKKGTITKEQYAAKLKELLDGQEITQEDHDEAKDFDPTDPDQELRYTQHDVNEIVKRKAVALLRQSLKAAGVDIDAPNKDLLGKVVDLTKAGLGNNVPDSELAKEVAGLRVKAGLVETLQADNKRLTLEAAVLKAAGKYNPVNAAQVVRALGDYADLLQYDDEDRLVPKSVDRALARIAETEPNLFKTPAGDGSEGGEGNDDAFKGKGPGGGGTAAEIKAAAEKAAKMKAEAREMLGLPADKK